MAIRGGTAPSRPIQARRYQGRRTRPPQRPFRYGHPPPDPAIVGTIAPHLSEIRQSHTGTARFIPILRREILLNPAACFNSTRSEAQGCVRSSFEARAEFCLLPPFSTVFSISGTKEKIFH